jgi:hypothetical protein
MKSDATYIDLDTGTETLIRSKRYWSVCSNEELKTKLENGETVYIDSFYGKQIIILESNREDLIFLCDLGNGMEKFHSWEGLVRKVEVTD